MADKHSKKNNKGKTGSNANVPKKKPGLLIYVPAFCSLIGTLMLLVVIAAALPLTVPNFMGYDVYNVVSGSMEPTIPIGSIIYVKDTEYSAIIWLFGYLPQLIAAIGYFVVFYNIKQNII
jgi:signal peptidase I